MADSTARSTRIVHFDFSTGASGDKILGALLEACESLGLAGFDDLRTVADALVGGLLITREKVLQGGIIATSLRINEPHPPHRHWSDIRKMIETISDQGVISESAKQLALSAFQAVALAEADVHNEPIEHVHFHEIGAADSIIDIVGSCYLFDLLAPAAAYASPLVLGFGTFKAAHGEMSVPAPATTRLIDGLTVTAGPHEGEMTTPTGAALAAAFITHWRPFTTMRPIAYGYGAGTRTVPGTANVVRLLVGEAVSETAVGISGSTYLTIENVTLIEANIDHRTPEALAFAAEELLAAGALDVWQEPITMKKGRLATRLALLCQPDQGNRLCSLFVALTGSLGVRMRFVERAVLARESVEIETEWGKVRFKSGHYAGEFDPSLNTTRWLRPEHDDVARLAREHRLDYQELYDELCALADMLGLA